MAAERAVCGPQEHAALRVLSAALGGYMSSRLWLSVREARGLAYSVSSDVDAFEEVAIFGVCMG